MIRYFTKAKLMFVITVLPFTFLFMIIHFFLTMDGPLYAWLIRLQFEVSPSTVGLIRTGILLCFLASGALPAAFAANRYALSLHDELLFILFYDCDPARFLREYEPLAMKRHQRKKVRLLLQSNLALGFLTNGETEMAVEMYSRIREETAGTHADGIFVESELQLCSIALDNNDMESAWTHYDAAKRYFNGKAFRDRADELDMRFEIARGNYAAPLAYFESALRRNLLSQKNAISRYQMKGALSRYQCAVTRFRLADLYGRLGDTARQIDSLKAVAETAKLLHIARMAEQQVEAMA